ncbi:MAG: helix-turn-helix domain-containing protein [Aeromonas veronii]
MGQKELDREDWTRWQILQAVKAKGMSLRQLSMRSGKKPGTLYNALRGDGYQLGEQIIAEFIEVPASVIWADRFRRRMEAQAMQEQAVERVEVMRMALRA